MGAQQRQELSHQTWRLVRVGEQAGGESVASSGPERPSVLARPPPGTRAACGDPLGGGGHSLTRTLSRTGCSPSSRCCSRRHTDFTPHPPHSCVVEVLHLCVCVCVLSVLLISLCWQRAARESRRMSQQKDVPYVGDKAVSLLSGTSAPPPSRHTHLCLGPFL